MGLALSTDSQAPGKISLVNPHRDSWGLLSVALAYEFQMLLQLGTTTSFSLAWGNYSSVWAENAPRQKARPFGATSHISFCQGSQFCVPLVQSLRTGSCFLCCIQVCDFTMEVTTRPVDQTHCSLVAGRPDPLLSGGWKHRLVVCFSLDVFSYPVRSAMDFLSIKSGFRY